MAKEAKTQFECQSCGYVSPKYLGRCPNCGQWNSMVEEAIRGTSDCCARVSLTGKRTQPQRLSEVIPKKKPHVETELVELNRVLGDGVVLGSLVLVGSDPGIGKSTSFLQISQQLAVTGGTVLYVSGRESVEQIKLQVGRLGTVSKTFYLYVETGMYEISRAIERLEPGYIIIDSIQTMMQPDVTNAAGSAGQVRETIAELLKLTKTNGATIFIVERIAKGESIAGPRMLKHMVDTVLYFEGDKHHTLRILRVVKNRLGPTNEIGTSEMQTHGSVGVMNPSQVLLEERLEGATGPLVAVAMEDSRPIPVEIRALITPATFSNTKRTTVGLDPNRIFLIMTVLGKRAGPLLQNRDVCLKAAGGVKINEPATSLVLTISIAPSYKERGISSSECFIGEIDLTGEIRHVNSIEQRVHEVQRLGFTKVYVPKDNLGGWEAPEGIEIIDVSTIDETSRKVFE